MFESKYSKVLTIILVIVIIGILGLLGFLAYDYYHKYVTTSDAEDFVNSFDGDVAKNDEDKDKNNENQDNNVLDQLENMNGGTNQSASSQKTRPQYKGFGVLGTMTIPKINLKYPILEKMTKSSIEVSVAFLWGVGINQPGNTVIVGHNYRNGAFFSNNKKLNLGDKIYITDNDGKQVTYTIYNKFETSDTDTSFYQRDTAGKAEVTLSTCTDNGKQRLIILARAD